MFTIIEDCSPYYIRFTHDNIDKIINICLSESDKTTYSKPFTHQRLDPITSLKLLQLTPVAKCFDLKKDRVSLFVTQPGYYYRAHKDGLAHRISVNYTIKVLDDKCVTSWYDDSIGSLYETDTLNGASRELTNFDKTKHTPLKSMTAIQGEGILFNTEIFHDFDNSDSTNERIVLTLRALNLGGIYFDDAKKLMFNL